MTVGEAIGLQSVPTFAMQMGRENARRRQGEEAAKRAREEKEFDILMSDLKVDPSKYHRLDRERAAKLGQETYQKLFDLYSKRDPTWRNQASQILYDYKFQDGQIQVDSKVKFDAEKYVETPGNKVTPQLQEYYKWLREGSFGAPPPITPDPYGQIPAWDPNTGTAGFVPAKQVNLPKFIEKEIYDPALAGYELDPKSRKQVGTDVYHRENAVYNPAIIASAVGGTAGGEQFLNWRLDNSDKIRASVQANPTLPPEEVILSMWGQFIDENKPSKFNEVRENKAPVTNINVGGTVPAKAETLYSNYSNVATREVADPNQPLSFQNSASLFGGKIVYKEGTDDPWKIELKVPAPLTAKTIEVAPGRAMIGKTLLNERTQGKMARQELMWGTMDADGNFDVKSQDEYNKLPPEERAKVKPFIRVFYEETAPEKKGDEIVLGDDGQPKYNLTGRKFTVLYNMTQGSPDVDELNAIDQGLTVTAKQKTELGTGEPGAYETNPKYEGQVTPTTPTEPAKPTKKKLY